MAQLLLATGLFYILHLMALIPVSIKMGPEAADRCKRAITNLTESLPMYFMVVIAAIYTASTADDATTLLSHIALIGWLWLGTRVVFAYIYVSGLGAKSALIVGEIPNQPMRSMIWMLSILQLLYMGIVIFIEI